MAKVISGQAFDFPILTRIFSYITPYKKIFYWSVVLTLLTSALSPLLPWLVQLTVDKYIMQFDSAGLVQMLYLMIALLLIRSGISFAHTYYTNLLGQLAVKDMRTKLFERIVSFRTSYFDHTPVGTLVTRTVSDMETVADIFSEGLIVIIGDLLTLFFIIAFMFYVDWRLTLISLSTIPLLIIAANVFKNGIKEAFREVRTQVARLNAFVQEHITGMSIVQIFNREETELKKFNEINALHRNAHIKSNWYYSIFFPVVELLSAASIGLLIWWGASGVIRDEVTLGNLVAFIMYISMLFRPIRELADKFNTLQLGMVSSERIFKVFDTNEFIANNGTIKDRKINGDIRFENVSFAYVQDDWVLKDLSLHMPAGKMTALVGATGSGKSSIVNAISRLYEYQQGNIYLDEISIRDYELSFLRRNIAMVMQDVFLFSDTVFNNITLNDSSITRSQVIEAARAVGVDRFIERLPGKFDYRVGERGATLSTGQRQLLSFVRAYVYNPSILILDEATSSIDTETELLIREATARLTKNRTSIVVAHRLATIQQADKIIVLEHGKIVEEGTHFQLLRNSGLYKELYEIQFAAL
ncbi:MAG: ABC transporter ATP-binding protein [Bacteroidia bacterium]|nr:ABC transporter ATP-binding protein [Bacteroidia bacterium]